MKKKVEIDVKASVNQTTRNYVKSHVDKVITELQ